MILHVNLNQNRARYNIHIILGAATSYFLYYPNKKIKTICKETQTLDQGIKTHHILKPLSFLLQQ
jgi:hypothetical protein